MNPPQNPYSNVEDKVGNVDSIEFGSNTLILNIDGNSFFMHTHTAYKVFDKPWHHQSLTRKEKEKELVRLLQGREVYCVFDKNKDVIYLRKVSHSGDQSLPFEYTDYQLESLHRFWIEELRRNKSIYLGVEPSKINDSLLGSLSNSPSDATAKEPVVAPPETLEDKVTGVNLVGIDTEVLPSGEVELLPEKIQGGGGSEPIDLGPYQQAIDELIGAGITVYARNIRVLKNNRYLVLSAGECFIAISPQAENAVYIASDLETLYKDKQTLIKSKEAQRIYRAGRWVERVKKFLPNNEEFQRPNNRYAPFEVKSS